jgi:excisionase family DNA binding protein
MSELIDILKNPERVNEIPQAELARLLGEVELLKDRLLSRSRAADYGRTKPPDKSDQLLTVEEAAKRLGCSKDWLYRQSKKLPFVLRVGRHLRFSELGIEKYIRRKMGAWH